MSSDARLTVSLEPHLKDTLQNVLHILPADLNTALSTELDREEIYHRQLSDLAKWARSDAGAAALKQNHLDPLSYSMVALLAGTRTSPSKTFPAYEPPESPEAAARREWSERKALVAVVNGLLSVGCSGAAAWWAADKSGWKDEWKVLLALMVAAIVGFSETVLYIIWQSRKAPRMRVRRAVALKKREDEPGSDGGPDHDHVASTTGVRAEDTLRRRLPLASGTSADPHE